MDAQTLQPGQDGYFENVIWPKRRRLMRLMNLVPWFPGRWLRRSVCGFKIRETSEGAFTMRRGIGARRFSWAVLLLLAPLLTLLLALIAGASWALAAPAALAALIRGLIWWIVRRAERIDDLIEEHGARIVIVLDLYGNDVGDTATVA